MISAPPQTPNYAQGFARYRGESAYPELWDGLVGLWAPLLGATGGVLFNWSPQGRAHDGTLVNMDPATDWIDTRYGWALDLPASSGYVDCGKPSALAISGRPNISVVGLIKLHSLVTYGAFWDNSPGGADSTMRFHFGVYNDQMTLLIGDGVGYDWITSSSVLSAGTWLHVGVTVSANNEIIFYCNGAECGKRTLNRDLASSAASWKIGRPFSMSAYGLNALVPVLAVYDRVLPPGLIQPLCGVPAVPLRLRRRVPRMLPAIGGPYRVTARQTFHTGAAAGEPFLTGAAEGETFSTGSILGECHGRNG